MHEAFSQIKQKRVLLVGDLLLDRYTFGATKRISPEAPVPVLHVDREEIRLGGAGNVASNLKALGQDVLLLGRVGDDASGRQLISSCNELGISSEHIVVESGLTTPTKVRLIAASQQIVRIDYEQARSLSQKAEQAIIERIPHLVGQVDVVAISDYAKGFLTDLILDRLTREARSIGIPVITDPKGAHFGRYSGTTILKPNLHEAYAAAQMSADLPLEEVAAVLHSRLDVDVLMITRSEDGISLYFRDGQVQHFPVVKKDVRDVTGAGDTVLSVLAAGVASGLDFASIIPLCNVAASVAIERVGCAIVSWEDIAARTFESIHHGKVLRRSDLPLLRYAFGNKSVALVQVGSNDTETLALLKAVHDLAKQSQCAVITHFTDQNSPAILLETAAALESVHAVLTGCILTSEVLSNLKVVEHILI